MSNTGSCVAVAVYALRRRQGAIELLFLHRSGGQLTDRWWPVTGKREDSENPGQCALRELREETGLSAESLYQTDITAPVEGGGYLRIFVAPVDASARVRLNWEHDAHRWCSPEEAHAIVGSFPKPIVEEVVRIFETQPPERKVVTGGEPNVRAESPADQQQIHDVVAAAFNRPQEARLVDLIRERDQVLVSLVAECDAKIVGHVLVSAIALGNDTSETYGGVAPLSVLPAYQREGIGARLMRAAIQQSGQLGLSALFLLGNPGYYSRFGFTRSHIGNEYGATDAFMHLELRPESLAGIQGTARYVDAFSDIGV